MTRLCTIADNFHGIIGRAEQGRRTTAIFQRRVELSTSGVGRSDGLIARSCLSLVPFVYELMLGRGRRF